MIRLAVLLSVAATCLGQGEFTQPPAVTSQGSESPPTTQASSTLPPTATSHNQATTQTSKQLETTAPATFPTSASRRTVQTTPVSTTGLPRTATAAATSSRSSLRFLRQPVAKVTLLMGQRVLLVCQVTGFANAPRYEWWKDNAKVDASIDNAYNVLPNGSLLLHARGGSFSGQYQCRVHSNDDGTTVSSSLSNVIVATIQYQFRVNPSSVTIRLNHIGMLNCSIDSIPPANITWYQDQIKVQTSSTVTVTQTGTFSALTYQLAQYSNSGTYYCVAVNSRFPQVQVKSKTAIFSVQGLPLITVPPASTYEPEGGKAVFQCQVASNPTATVTWIQPNGQTITRNSSRFSISPSPNFNLTVAFIAKSDTGKWTCSATNSFGTRSVQFEVTVLDRLILPVITTRPLSQSAAEGSSATFVCAATGSPVPAIGWLKDGVSFDLHDSRVTWVPATGRLTISQLRLADAGVYRCQASNVGKTVTAEATLSVERPPVIAPLLSDQTVTEGKTFTVECRSTAIPTAAITWRHNGQNISTSQRLTRSPVALADGGKYECEAKNNVGTATSTFTLTVQELPRINRAPSNSTITVGSTVTLQCSATGAPAPQISWLLNRAPLPSELRYSIDSQGFLSITGALLSDGGAYTCLARSSVGTASATAFIRVSTRPTFRVYPKDETVVLGRQLRLVCDVQATIAPVYTWLWPDSTPVVISPSQGISLNGGNITITSVSLAANGVFVCIARIPIPQGAADVSVRAGAKVTVTVPPTIVSKPQDVVVVRGNQVLLLCSVTGSPTPTVSWTFQGRTLVSSSSPTNSRYLMSRNGTLTVRNLRKATDEGTYTCTAKNSAGTASAAARIRVQEPPVVVVLKKVVTVSSRSAVLTCQAPGADPTPTIFWSFSNGTRVPATSHFITARGTLNIIAATVADEGSYVCNAANFIGSSTGSTFLEVLVVPMTTQLPSPTFAHEGSNLTLWCNSTGKPAPTRIWRFNNLPLSFPNVIIDGNNSERLTIVGVQTATFGQWSCECRNIAGVSGLVTTIVVQTRPTVAFVRQGTVTSRNVTIQWNLAFDGNSPVTNFAVNYTEAGGSKTSETLVGSNEVKFTYAGLSPFVAYNFRVRAKNAVGFGAYSKAVNVTTYSTAPPALTSVSVTTISSSALQVKWAAPSPLNGPLNAYEVRFRPVSSTGSFRTTGRLPFTTTVTVIEGQPFFTEFTIGVRAATNSTETVGRVFWGPWSNSVVGKTGEVAPRAAPRNVTVRAISATSIVVSWWEPKLESQGGLITSYYIFLRAASGSSQRQTVKAQPGEDGYQSHTISDVLPGTAYTVTMQALTSAGNGPNSTMATATTEASKSSSSNTGTIVGIAVGSVVFLLIVIVAFFMCRQHRETGAASNPAKYMDEEGVWDVHDSKQNKKKQKKEKKEKKKKRQEGHGYEMEEEIVVTPPAHVRRQNDYEYQTDYPQHHDDLYAMPDKSKKSTKSSTRNYEYDEDADEAAPPVPLHPPPTSREEETADPFGDMLMASPSNASLPQNEHHQVMAARNVYEDPSESAPLHHMTEENRDAQRFAAEKAAAEKRAARDREQRMKKEAKEHAAAQKVRDKAMKEEQKRREKAEKEARKLREKEEKQRQKEIENRSSTFSETMGDDMSDFASGLPGESMKGKKKKKKGGMQSSSSSSASAMMF